LVSCPRARELGFGPDDFGLERVLLGGEIVSEAMQRRVREVLGPIQFVQNYGMTELVPFGASVCNQGAPALRARRGAGRGPRTWIPPHARWSRVRRA
jgi:acyl-CoA synthetase (AMP-forming)/AMP-acid ligase II